MDFSAFLILIILLLVIILAYFIFKRSNGNNQSADIKEELRQITNSLDAKLHETNRIIFDQLNASNSQLQNQGSSSNELLRKINENNAKILQEVTEKLVKVEDTNKQVVGFAQQLQSLENIFRSPKQRGILGEYFLETILSNVLPETVYQMQYKFNDGTIVDAIVNVKDKIIPIDAKFSLDSFNRLIDNQDLSRESELQKSFLNDVKKRIEETSKYVKTNENTIDIAFMFVPSDAIYTEIIELSNDPSVPINLISYAYAKKVVLVSPTSFFAYLQTVLLALNTLKIEGQIEDIIKYLNESSTYLNKFEDAMNKLGKNIQTLTNSFNRASVTAVQMTKRISKVTSNKETILNIEKVESEDNERLE